MKLSEIDRLPSFALLGPGFADGITLVSPLIPAPDGCVAFVEYEGTRLRRFGGPRQSIAFERDIPAAPLSVSLDESGHREGVQAIRAAIAAGDVYQVNLTLRATISAVSGAQLLATLFRRVVPRFAAWIRLPDGTEIVSASPELFFEIRGSRIRCEPMKGTARLDASATLAGSAKDTAELAMITDLIRNDLTPICRPRSVRVTCERRFIELPYAMQAVSDVEGDLLPGKLLQDVVTALHPGGSITGAPKHAAQTMIQALERSPRGAYCGALGYITDERATFSLLIRTATLDSAGWVYGVGGGIVWDSDPERELEEVRVKLGALQ